MKKIFLSILCFFLMCSVGWTATTACDGSLADCQTKVTNASDGDTITINDGTFDWSSGTLTFNARTGNKALTIRGLHDCTLNTSEISTGIPTSCGTNITGMALSFTGSPAKKFRFAHVRLTGATSGIIISIDGDSNYTAGGGWRIDHIFFDNVVSSNRPVWLDRMSTSYGLSDGVIDHCNILDPNTIFFQYQIHSDGGNREWTSALGLGTVAAVYVEDTKLFLTNGNVSAPFSESQGGGRYVFRYNVIHNGYLDAHDAIVNNMRGVRKYEVYNNTFTYDAQASWVRTVTVRGGTGVYFNNTTLDPTISIVNTSPQFAVYRTYEAGGNPWENLCGAASPTYSKACLNTQGTYPQSCAVETDCGGTNGVTQYCVLIDGTGSPAGYPCRDQLGVDQNTDGTQSPGVKPFLVWNNTYNGAAAPPEVDQATYMVSDMDYCYNATTLPSTCHSIATNTYWPGAYTYPHPLNTDTGGGATGSSLSGGTCRGCTIH